MANIELNENTARELAAAALAVGMTVDEFVRARLLAGSSDLNGDSSTSLLGSMAGEADLLDEVISDVYAARETHRLRLNSDG